MKFRSTWRTLHEFRNVIFSESQRCETVRHFEPVHDLQQSIDQGFARIFCAEIVRVDAESTCCSQMSKKGNLVVHERKKNLNQEANFS